MKVIILAAGLGTRLRPLTDTLPKAMIPVAGRPLIDHTLEKAAEAGITDVCIVVGYLREAIEAHVGDGSRWGLNVSYAFQAERLGLAHAVKQAGSFVDGPFVVLLSDNLYSEPLSSLRAKFEAFGGEAGICVTPVDNPSQFGVVELEGDKIVRMVEKPKNPKTNLAIVGIYFFNSPKLLGIIDSLKPSWRGEYEITDAIQGLIDDGDDVYAIQVEGWWKDTGTFEDLKDIEEMLKAPPEGSIEKTVGRRGRKTGGKK